MLMIPYVRLPDATTEDGGNELRIHGARRAAAASSTIGVSASGGHPERIARHEVAQEAGSGTTTIASSCPRTTAQEAANIRTRSGVTPRISTYCITETCKHGQEAGCHERDERTSLLWKPRRGESSVGPVQCRAPERFAAGSYLCARERRLRALLDGLDAADEQGAGVVASQAGGRNEAAFRQGEVRTATRSSTSRASGRPLPTPREWTLVARLSATGVGAGVGCGVGAGSRAR